MKAIPIQEVSSIFKHVIDRHLELRLLDFYHAEAIYRVIERNREHLSEWFPWVNNTLNVEQTRAFIELELSRLASNNGCSTGIFYDDEYIGNISFHDIHWTTKMTSIGYWISAEFQGRGIMTRCCQAMMHHGFENLGLNKIEIRARTDNEKSKAIPIRLGFKEEGTLRQVSFHNGRYYDHVVYGLLKEEWKR